MSHLTSVNKVSGNRNSQLLSTTVRIVFGYFEYISLSAPPMQPSTCLRESLHFGFVPSYCNLTFIYWFTVLVFLYSFSFGGYCPLFHTFAFVFSPGSAADCLSQISTKLRLFSRSIVSTCFAFIYQLYVFVVICFLLSLCSDR
jgi:hypothetical protein